MQSIIKTYINTHEYFYNYAHCIVCRAAAWLGKLVSEYAERIKEIK